MRVAILRYEKLPSFVTWDIPDIDELSADDMLLINEFESRGHNASPVIWSDSAIDWNDYDIALIRSTWDYIDRRDEFLNVLSVIEASSCKLFNPLKAVRWNSDKLYLFDLQKLEIPIVPTFKAAGRDLKVLAESFTKNNWNEAVLKPIVGGGGADVYRLNTNEICSKYEALHKRQPDKKYLIQPLVESVMTEGEWSYIYINENLCNVLLKKPATGDFRSHVIYGGSIQSIKPHKDDLQQADTILAKIPFDLLYARLDLVRMGDRLAVMELELIEPILYFKLAPKAIERLVSAAIRKADH